MEGFATFRERTVLEFDDLDLVALTGSTGAGKSTVIDAMTFALYGSVPRYGNAGVVEPVIHQLAAEAKVRFDFEVGGRLYTATRITRRQQRSSSGKGGRRATTKEARLERAAGDDAAGDAASEVLAGSVTELDSAVVSLLGLTFNQFTRTVVLPQGEFANFLRDEPLKRQELLKRLLDLEIYSRMGTEARARAEAAGQQATTLEHELSLLKVPDDDEVAAIALRLKTLNELGQRVGDWVSELDVYDRALEPLRDRAAAMAADIDALAAVVPTEEAKEQAEALAEAEVVLHDAAAAADRARTELEHVRVSTAKLGDRGQLIERRQQLMQAQDADRRLEALSREHGEVTQRRSEAETTLASTEQQRIEVDQQLSVARHVGDASHLLAGLTVGEPCPVCRQTIDELPVDDGEIDHSRDSAAELESTLAAVTVAVRQATATHAAASAELKAIEAQQAEWRQIAAGGDDQHDPGSRSESWSQLQAMNLDDIDKMLTSLEALAVDERQAMAAVGDADRSLATAKATVDDIQARLASGRQQFGRYRDSVAHLGPPEVGFESLADDWQALAEWAGQRRGEVEVERSELVAEGKRHRAERDRLSQQLVSAVAAVGLTVAPGDLNGAVGVVSSATSDARLEQQRADDARTQAKRLTDSIAERNQLRDLNRELGRHLSARGFEAWLLAEALDDITARATARLLELSAGRYSLVAADRDIAIVDHHNADEQRAARTLSGGETFLASLALALALADSIADLAPVDAPRLESMFLDEGFGTLDPDTLDVVAQAIEELAASGRMIGIVTHVRDLAERMPARFEIQKLPGGSTVELVTL